jgi:hypothetical protein
VVKKWSFLWSIYGAVSIIITNLPEYSMGVGVSVFCPKPCKEAF